MVGVRSPAALELVRQLAFHGLAVEGADFLHFPLGRFSCRLRAYHRLPSPRWHATQFENAWNRLLEQPYAAVFACNEEIFWLSRQALQPPLAAWHGPFGLERLHRKDEFVRLLQEAGLPSPARRTCLARMPIHRAGSGWISWHRCPVQKGKPGRCW